MEIFINILNYGSWVFGVLSILRLIALIFAAWNYEGSAEQMFHNIKGKNLDYPAAIIKTIFIILVCGIIIFAINNQ